MSWLRWRKRRRSGAFVVVLTVLFAGAVFSGIAPERRQSLGDLPLPERALPHRRVREITFARDPSDEAVLGRPIALALDADTLYIADALDCAVKMFTSDGVYLGLLGRKGQGPGELSFPSGVCAAGPVIAVADKLNSRVQYFDRAGRAAGGFKLPFAPDRILALGPERFLVTSNPAGRRAGEKLLHICDREGRLLWDGLEAAVSPDPIRDAFRNMVLVCAGGEGDFYVIFRSGVRTIRRYSSSGDLLGAIDVDQAYSFKNVETPDTGRGRLKLAGFCWAAAFDQGRLYLAPPEILDGQDLGPGRKICVLGAQGRLQARLELPCAVHRFLVSGGRLAAIDDQGDLRVFEVGR